MNDLQQQIEKLKSDAKAIELANNKLIGNKAHYSMDAVATFIQSVKVSLSEIADILRDNESYDKDLGKVLSDSISKAVGEFTKIKPPQITVNLKPIENILSELTNHNKNIIDLLSRMPQPTGNNNELSECYKLMTETASKTNQLLEMALSPHNKTEDPKEDKPLPAKATIVRDSNRDMKEVIFTYK